MPIPSAFTEQSRLLVARQQVRLAHAMQVGGRSPGVLADSPSWAIVASTKSEEVTSFERNSWLGMKLISVRSRANARVPQGGIRERFVRRFGRNKCGGSHGSPF